MRLNEAKYVVERSYSKNSFTAIGTVHGSEDIRQFSFTDANLSYKDNSYRVKMITANGSVYYSNTVTLNSKSTTNQVHLKRSYGENKLFIEMESVGSRRGMISILNLNGELIKKQAVTFVNGKNSFDITGYQVSSNSIQVIVVHVDNQLAFSEKLVRF